MRRGRSWVILSLVAALGSGGAMAREDLPLRATIEKELTAYAKHNDKAARRRFMSAVQKVGICKEENYGMGEINELYPYHDELMEYSSLLEEAMVRGEKDALGGDRKAVAYLFALVPLATDGALAEGISDSIGKTIKKYPVEFLGGIERCWRYLRADHDDIRLVYYLRNIGIDFADDFEGRKAELESRRRVLAHTTYKNEEIKKRCIAILDELISRTQQIIESESHNKAR